MNINNVYYIVWDTWGNPSMRDPRPITRGTIHFNPVILERFHALSMGSQNTLSNLRHSLKLR